MSNSRPLRIGEEKKEEPIAAKYNGLPYLAAITSRHIHCEPIKNKPL